MTAGIAMTEPALSWNILVPLAKILQMSAGIFLLSIVFYLQVIAYDPYAKHEGDGGHRVPFQFRWPPFLLGVILLDLARGRSFVPFSDAAIAVIIYTSFIYLAWICFAVVMAYYDVPLPRKRIPQLIREVIEDVRDGFH